MFDIQGNKIILKTDELAIPPFKDYYNNAKDKSKAIQDIEFVIWRYRWNTPYEAYPEKERTYRVAKDVFKDEHYEQTAEAQTEESAQASEITETAETAEETTAETTEE